MATAESYLPAQPPALSPPPAVPTARLFAELISRAPPANRFPTLRAPLPWVGWDHADGATWPHPDDLDIDLNAEPAASALDDVADRVRLRLRRDNSPEVIGHADWEADNLGWLELEPVVVYDWDSVAIRTEPTLAGAAATVFAATSGERVAATVEQTDAFLTAFQSVRGRCTPEQLQTAWAAGLWVLLFNAKKEAAGGGSGYLRHLSGDLDDRMRRAGL